MTALKYSRLCRGMHKASLIYVKICKLLVLCITFPPFYPGVGLLLKAIRVSAFIPEQMLTSTLLMPYVIIMTSSCSTMFFAIKVGYFVHLLHCYITYASRMLLICLCTIFNLLGCRNYILLFIFIISCKTIFLALFHLNFMAI